MSTENRLLIKWLKKRGLRSDAARFCLNFLVAVWPLRCLCALSTENRSGRNRLGKQAGGRQTDKPSEAVEATGSRHSKVGWMEADVRHYSVCSHSYSLTYFTIDLSWCAVSACSMTRSSRHDAAAASLDSLLLYSFHPPHWPIVGYYWHHLQFANYTTAACLLTKEKSKQKMLGNQWAQSARRWCRVSKEIDKWQRCEAAAAVSERSCSIRREGSLQELQAC